MLISRKYRQSEEPEVVTHLVSAYLALLKTSDIPLTCSEISEILRCSMCQALGLDTKGYSEKVEAIAPSMARALKSIMESHGVLGKSEEYNQGLLEACVHSIELSRKRVLGVTV